MENCTEEVKKIEEALCGLVKIENTNIFDFITKSLCEFLHVDYALISIFQDNLKTKARALSFFVNGKLIDKYEYILIDTPCDLVINTTNLVFYEKNVQTFFPKNFCLKEMQINSYLGGALIDENQKVIGILAVMSRLPLLKTVYVERVFEAYRTRANIELSRYIVEKDKQNANNIYAEVLKLSPFCIFLVDEKGTIKYCNRPAVKLFGYSEAELINQDIKKLIPKEFRNRHNIYVDSYMNNPIKKKIGREMNIYGQTKSGKLIPLDINLTPLKTSSGTQVICSVMDISEQKTTENNLIQMAKKDSLTKLPNRVALFEKLAAVIAKKRADKTSFAVLYVDLDNFKSVNDLFGHQVGDLLLVEIANRIFEACRTSDFIARVGGDEFIIVSENISSKIQAGNIAKRVMTKLADSLDILGNNIFLTTSIGIAIYPEDGKLINTLIKNSDTAMYDIKKSGKNGYGYFTKIIG